MYVRGVVYRYRCKYILQNSTPGEDVKQGLPFAAYIH